MFCNSALFCSVAQKRELINSDNIEIAAVDMTHWNDMRIDWTTNVLAKNENYTDKSTKLLLFNIKYTSFKA